MFVKHYHGNSKLPAQIALVLTRDVDIDGGELHHGVE